MSKQARATAQSQKSPEGAPSSGRVSLRTFAGGSLPGSDEHTGWQQNKPFSLRDMQRWPELSIIPVLATRDIRSGKVT